ncbi:MAG: hypothetical protein NZ957_05795 [Thaumarchaeota archaeon]|nr:hypothetical protein [Candidatus Calditenuaceae archaeon]
MVYFQLAPGVPSRTITIAIRLTSTDREVLDKWIDTLSKLARDKALNVQLGRRRLRPIFGTPRLGYQVFRDSVIVYGSRRSVNAYLATVQDLVDVMAEDGVLINFTRIPTIMGTWVIIELESESPQALIQATIELRDRFRKAGHHASERFRPVILGQPRTSAIRIRYPVGVPAYDQELRQIITEFQTKYGTSVRLTSVHITHGIKPHFALEDSDIYEELIEDGNINED